VVKKTMDMFDTFAVETPEELMVLDKNARKTAEALLS